jgi:hypothetical protein
MMQMPLLARQFTGIDDFIHSLYQQGLHTGYCLAQYSRWNSDLPFIRELNEEERHRGAAAAAEHAEKMGPMFATACMATLTEMRQFFEGVSKALNHGSFQPDGAPVGATKRYRVLRVLVDNVDEVQKCQNIPQLHRWMCQKLGSTAPDYKTLEKLCQEIGLTLTRRGQPPHR